jgi:hypothetical protein
MTSVVEGGKLAFLHQSPSGVLVSPSGRGVWFVAWRFLSVVFALYCPCIVVDVVPNSLLS